MGGSDKLQENSAMMDQFIAPIAIFTGVLSIGVISGGLAFIMSFLKKLPHSQMRYEKQENRSK